MNARTVSLILCAILLVWTAAVFLPARHFSFVNWDDYDEVVENKLLHPPTVQNLRAIWAEPHLGLYAPLSYTAWWAMSRIPGAADNPAWFHLLNLFLHLAAAGLVFSIVRACVKSPIAAFGGAAIFALHPVQVESLGWVAEMNNVLAAALSLGAIRLYLAFRGGSPRRRWIYFAMGSAVFLLALLSKPTAVVTPIIAAILDWGFFRTSWKRVTVSLGPWVVAAGVFAWVAHASQPAGAAPVVYRPIVAMDALSFYFGKLIWPAGLTIDYGRTPKRILEAHVWAGDALVLVTLILILWLLWKNYRGVAIGVMIFVAGLLPVLGLVPFSFQEFSTVADHFMYLGMLGAAVAVAAILLAMPARGALPVGIALSVVMAAMSSGQLRTWRDSGTLVGRTLEIDPGSAIGNGIAGAEMNRAGQPARAVPFFSAAIARDPIRADFHSNLGNSLLLLGEFDKAIDEFEQAISLANPPSWRVINNLGVAYAKTGRRGPAIERFRRVLEIDPGNAQATENLRILQGDGKIN